MEGEGLICGNHYMDNQNKCKILLPVCVGGCGLTTAIATPNIIIHSNTHPIATPNIIIYSFHSHTPILQFTHHIATPNSPLFSQPRPYTIGSDVGDDTESDTESDTGDDTESDTGSDTFQRNRPLLQPPHHWVNKPPFYFE